MSCQTCGSDHILAITGKSDDKNSVTYQSITEILCYVPSGINIGGGDYIKFKLCLNCGQIQGTFPVIYQTGD